MFAINEMREVVVVMDVVMIVDGEVGEAQQGGGRVVNLRRMLADNGDNYPERYF